ncbi:hypothetical protein F53441_13932 [Fusarium austroafricanum]|uniref:Uncharacterized protein n=1 Tax=Fusarium austroafricanum TaxID=2364996 RepID=A0A8H4NIT3_9HYPO|nr:hypothetical protein F53441_13932 [Fusarium austroafricanum]
MASWLLDDSTHERPSNGEENSSPKKGRAITPSISLSNSVSRAISPLDLPSPVKTPPKSSDRYPRGSRAVRLSPRKSPGRVPRRAATTGIRRDISKRRTISSLQRHHGPTRSLSLDPLKFHPTNNVTVSTPLPLGAVDKNARNHVTEEHHILATQKESASGEEINEKLVAMLAATNALKPSPPLVTPSSSRFTRMVPSKVRAKVSNAWDRFHPKTSAQKEKDAPTNPPPGGEESERPIRKGIILTPPSRVSPENLSPISNIELRLNEGDNLNKSKVQQIVGGRVNRKPLADDGKSLRNGKSIEDPFSERGDRRTPTIFESRLKKGVNNRSRTPSPLARNPFESEKGFDNNIEDRFLNSTPVGSSTPRIRVERPSTPSSESSSEAGSMDLPHRRFSEKLSSLSTSETEHLVQSHRPRYRLVGPGKGSLIDSVTQARQGWEREAGGMVTTGSNRMKKHPSPSKEALEKLEIQFQQYTHLHVTETVTQDMDELVLGGKDTSPPVKAYERKRLSLTCLSITNIDELAEAGHGGAHHRRGSSASMLRLVRSPYTLQRPIKLHKDIRLAPPYRPAGVSPSDVDELH